MCLPSFSACTPPVPLTHAANWGCEQGGTAVGKEKHAVTIAVTHGHLQVMATVPVSSSQPLLHQDWGGKRTDLSVGYLQLGTDKKLCILEKGSRSL